MILALSPHLDDMVFSCGGYLYDRAGEGERIRCLTIFTKTVEELSRFALACRLDKGLDGEIDYMALRRDEDREACRILGVEPIHWPYPEAPHRLYTSAADLFAGIHTDDPLDTKALINDLAAYLSAEETSEVLYPVGAGNHVDHLQLIAAVDSIRAEFPEVWFRRYYDMPYAAKFRERHPELGYAVPGMTLSEETFRKKMSACNAYTSQIGFQFGTTQRMEDLLGRVEYLV